MPTFCATTELPASQDEAFAWHARMGALPRLLPPFDPVRVKRSDHSIEDGSRVTLAAGPMGAFELVAEHDRYTPPTLFRDRLVSSPFRQWEHEHRFEKLGETRSRLIDEITYELPLGPVGDLGDRLVVSGKLDAMFAYRHRVTRDDLALHGQLATLGTTPKTVLVTGASGLVGRTLCAMLSTGGHTVHKVTRGQTDQPNEFGWSPKDRAIDPAALEGVDAIVHLAGESIIGRWNSEKKQRIRRSRVDSTDWLAGLVQQMPGKPALITASAIGWYGDRGDEIQTESAPVADDFLADVCREWEAAAEPAAQAGHRIAHVRLGIVLSPEGGALANMLPAFKLGAGGPVGDGSAYWSWVAIDDAAGLFAWAALNDAVSGPLNATAPQPLTSGAFADVLGDVLNRPTFLKVPAFAARAAFGEMADALLLASARVHPERTVESGYRFRFDDLGEALRHLLGKNRCVRCGVPV